MQHIKTRLLFVAVILLFILSHAFACTNSPDLDSTIGKTTDTYRFRLFNWELKNLSSEAWQSVFKRETINNSTSLEKQVENQVREAFSGQGINNPLDRFFNLKIGFPPVDIYLGKPPHLLVVSPRDRIENIREVYLLPEMDEKDMETIEADIARIGYSALVTDIGGLSTFPSYITEDADERFIIDSAAHEWLHLYLAFTPLGFIQLLDTIGLRQDYDVSTINETVADMVGREIGEIIYREYYAPSANTGNNSAQEIPSAGFDFNKEMREIRLAVDACLAKGEIEKAEKFMEEKRLFLADNDYHIRKLNQAYFAFYGTYADSPASVSPIGEELRKLRSRSASLKEFLDKVAAMNSRQDLSESVR
jgi:hypothetical protein